MGDIKQEENENMYEDENDLYDDKIKKEKFIANITNEINLLVNKHFEREKEVQLLKQQKRSNYQFEKTYNINDSPDTYYIDEETIDQFTKLNRRIANKIKTEVRNRIETFNSRDKLNISYLCEPLWIVLNEYITSGLLKINSRKFKFYFPNKVTVNAEFNFNTIKKNEKEEPESRYGIILKDQPKTVRILISAIETSEIHINYILSVWKNPSDRYNEKNSIQRLKNENSNTIEQKLNKILHLIEIRFTYSNEQEILDKPKLLIFAALFFKYCDQNPHLKKKPKKNDASTNTEQLNIEDIIDLINEERTEELHQALKDFKSRRKHMTSIFPLIKEVIQLLAFKSFNDDKESLPGKVSRKNAQQKVLEYLKVSLNLFLHCIAFGLVFFMGNPLGDIKSWNFMNETNFEKTFNLLKENDELKLALEKKNNSCETKIMNGLVDYANNLDLDIEDLSYLTKSSTLSDYNYTENQKDFVKARPTPKLTFINDKLKNLNLRDNHMDIDDDDEYEESLVSRENEDEDSEQYREIWENNKNEEEDDMNEVGEQNQSTMDYINQKENGEVIPYNIDNIDRNPKRVMRRIRKDENLDREKLMSYSDYIKRLRSDTSIYDMFKDDIDNLSLAITSLSSLRNPASRRPSKIEGLKRLTPDIFKLNKKIIEYLNGEWMNNIDLQVLFKNTGKFFDNISDKNITWYSKFHETINQEITNSVTHLRQLSALDKNNYNEVQFNDLTYLINNFDQEFTNSEQLSKPIIITRHAKLINEKAQEFLKLYYEECLKVYEQNLDQAKYGEEIGQIGVLIAEFDDPDKLRLFINLPAKKYDLERSIKNKIMIHYQNFQVEWTQFKQNVVSDDLIEAVNELSNDLEEVIKPLNDPNSQGPYYELAKKLNNLIIKGNRFIFDNTDL
ncbi:hypothetical protein C2G38_2214721 [Gigaspora rosea]|uniref:Uncharacterized protein n=1 Tax=Gigaspora rosea TaxID=44941 RepID=A0A397UJ27_9GLOM|nr:hypothetical protein C2G38_2214721 [Gigaspora rosea]